MLLERAGVAFEVRPSEIPERRRPGEAAAAFALRMACEKATAVARQAGPRPARRVLGADTLVVLDGEVIGKPADASEAESHLARLSGRSHRVITAVALARSDTGAVREVQVVSEVSMRPASAEEIRAYVATGEPLDKAGAYAVQGEGRRFVVRVRGSESNVIGLPAEETLGLLRAEGVVAASAN